jgi:hypothetical protein
MAHCTGLVCSMVMGGQWVPRCSTRKNKDDSMIRIGGCGWVERCTDREPEMNNGKMTYAIPTSGHVTCQKKRTKDAPAENKDISQCSS